MDSWTLRGTVLIACNCDYGCPCNVNGRPSTGKCEGGWTWRIDEGRWGDVQLDGLGLAVFSNWPAAIHEGGGVAVAFIDERADDGQGEALTTLVRGEAGGPWGLFINTYDLDGPRRVRFDVTEEGYRIGGLAELETEPIRNPVTGAEVHPRLLLPEGLVVKELDLVASRTFRIQDGVAYDHSGRYAATGPFDYMGPFLWEALWLCGCGASAVAPPPAKRSRVAAEPRVDGSVLRGSWCKERASRPAWVRGAV